MRVIAFVFLIPFPLAALQPPQPIEPVATYSSIASKYLGIGAVFQQPYGSWSSQWFGVGSYCIQQYLGNGAYSYSCLPPPFLIASGILIAIGTILFANFHVQPFDGEKI